LGGVAARGGWWIDPDARFLRHASAFEVRVKKQRPRSTKRTASQPSVTALAARDDAWRWHAGAAGAAPRTAKGRATGGRGKGPPPAKPKKTIARPMLVGRPLGKLAPELEARVWTLLPQPVLAVPVWQVARDRLARGWWADRLAVVMLLVPTLLTAAFVALLPMVKAPLERSTMVARWKIERRAASDVADVRMPIAEPARSARAEVSMPQKQTRRLAKLRAGRNLSPEVADDRDLLAPFVRPQTTVAHASLWTKRRVGHAVDVDPDAVVAVLWPPFVRLPEGLAQLVPMALHDLAEIVPALARDVGALQPPFVRPGEGLVAVVPRPVEGEGATTRPPVVEVTDAVTCRAPAGLIESAGGRRKSSLAQVSLSPLKPDAALADDPLRFGRALAEAAKAQSQDLVIYNAKYMQIAYPRGDVPSQFGVCTDVVIRAYRALEIDLQELVHQTRTGPSDSNIDHRRTELLRRFFATHGEQLAVSPYSEEYLPGDIVTYYRPQNKSSTAHIAVVTDVFAPSGRPMIAHNRGWGVQLEDALFVDQMTGHYRFRGLSATAIAAAPRGVSSGGVAAKRPVQKVTLVAAVKADAPSVALALVARTDALRAPMGLGVGGAATTARCDSRGGSLSLLAHCPSLDAGKP
jgi:uncharacterized protein